MKLLIKAYIVERCFDCDYWKSICGTNVCVFKDKERKIENANIIPEWCGLEDYKED
jgi:hypothetical protein